MDTEAIETCKTETKEHQLQVTVALAPIIERLQAIQFTHDASKLEEPELSLFAEWGPKLKTLTYGSDEYKAALKAMGPALQHHYESNRHHPEHHNEGVRGMNLVDLIEMVCDWKAASLRMKDGSLIKSLGFNANRFNLDPQLVKIIANTAELFDPS